MTLSLFEDAALYQAQREELCPGATVLRGFAAPNEAAIFEALGYITAQAPFRHLITPGGFRMSVAMTNCGSYGWVSDLTGYRYDATDPESGKPWPGMPDVFMNLAQAAAASGGFDDFEPDVCLINRYEAGARLSLHQDKNERGFSAPIVSVSLGIPAVFLWGGSQRKDKPVRIPLAHGDVMVWGGPARLRYHGILPVKEGCHPLSGAHRINLTFRKAV
ncbi:DNA oxidative demethylase AlkB [Nitrosovibrio sp. Nv6]|uniref:DNA oxidative demethylase AlkB n=1 Tax=Nitrosovibrio sp. Nv6 TaxID=1855340 RepID=UPI0008AEFB71|nr:DNA oxidative demethylase AlkB [Nitrosovibrio sp. Nv6]SEO42319.1 alkylated DNA repair protein (DNA oxidative demethylase) [Nitrosovibrio sp. Nv6]